MGGAARQRHRHFQGGEVRAGGEALIRSALRVVADCLRSLDRRSAVVLLTVTFSLLFLHYFAIVPVFVLRPRPLPLEPLRMWALLSFAAYFLVPGFIAVFVLRRPLSSFGLTFRGVGRHVPLYLLLYLLVLPFVWLASRQPEFLDTYPFCGEAREGLRSFLVWELYYGLQFFALEFFFRGFLLFGLEEKLGATAIVVMVVPYCMLHFQKPMLESTGAIFAGLILGFLALRTRSILGGVMIHWAVAISMDVFAILGSGGFAK